MNGPVLLTWSLTEPAREPTAQVHYTSFVLSRYSHKRVRFILKTLYHIANDYILSIISNYFIIICNVELTRITKFICLFIYYFLRKKERTNSYVIESTFILAMIETLGEPVKLREAGAKEEAKLCDFQEELVLLAAALCGDHRKEDFPGKLFEDMTVAKGAEYVKSAFDKFLNECERARQEGVDESTICIPNEDSTSLDENPNSKSLASKLFSCIVCSSD